MIIDCDIYLRQSRRLSKILKQLFGIKSHWANYTAWEYSLPNEEKLELTYAVSGDTNRFNIYTHHPKYKSILSTNSLKEVVNCLRKL